MPGGELAATESRKQATAAKPATTFDLDEYIYDALRAGASGFLLKDVPPHQLVQAVLTVGDGDALLSPAITRRLVEEFSASRAPRAPMPEMEQLSPRELEVFRLVARGLSTGRSPTSWSSPRRP